MNRFPATLEPLLFDIQPEQPDLDGLRAVDILTWQQFAGLDTLNQSPDELQPVVDAARRAGMHIVDVTAYRHSEPVERSAWIFPTGALAADFLSDIGGITVAGLSAEAGRTHVHLGEAFTTDLFGPTYDVVDPSLSVECVVLTPIEGCAAQPALFDIAA